MKQRLQAIFPFLLPMVLTLLLLWIFQVAEQKEKEWGGQKLENVLLQEAKRRTASIRGYRSYEFQSNQRNLVFRRELQRALKPRDAPPRVLTGEILTDCFQKAFPKAFRPPGTLLYGFRRTDKGGFVALEGPGLENRKGRMMAELFRLLSQAGDLSDADQAQAVRRCLGVFGEFCPFDLLAFSRQGKTTLGRFDGRPMFLTWDTIDLGKQFWGGFFLLVPQIGATTSHPLWRALHMPVPGTRAEVVPFYVPLEDADPRLKPVFPRGRQPSPSLRKLLRNLEKHDKAQAPTGKPGPGKEAARDLVIPLGRLVPLKGIGLAEEGYVFRDFLSLNSSYEIWVYFPHRARLAAMEWSQILTACLAIFWGGILARVLIFGRPLPISLRVWFPGFFALVGALPLSALFMAGTMQIRIAEDRDVQATREAAVGHLEELDAGNSALFLNFRETSLALATRKEWIRDLLDGTPKALERAAGFARRFFKGAGIPLRDILMLPLADEPRRFGWEYRVRATRSEFLFSFYRSIRDACLEILPGPGPTGKGAAGSSSTTLVGRWMAAMGLSMVEGKMTNDALYSRLSLSAYINLSGATIMACHDFLSSLGVPKTFSVLMCGTDEGYRWRLRRICERFEREVDPSHWLVFGQATLRGFKPVYHGLRGKFWHTQQGRSMRELMENAMLTGAPQVNDDDEAVFAALPCKGAPTLFLGTSVPLSGIRATARHRRYLLANLTVLIGLFILVLGMASARHLVTPLQEVETGLHRVGSGDLEVRVSLEREDELGLLTRSFDEMITGLKKRRDLGRFVSGALEATLGHTGPEESGKARVRRGAVLVSDLRGFTTLSECHPPETVVAMLNRHLEEMSSAITGSGGLIEMFIGDAVVAVFFDRDQGPGWKPAVEAALEMRRRHESLQEERRHAGLFQYEMGIGIDWGQILAGTLATSGRLDHAVLGRVRRHAEHLESASRLGRYSRIVLSEVTAGLVRAERPDLLLEPLERSEGMEIRILSPASTPPLPPPGKKADPA